MAGHGAGYQDEAPEAIQGIKIVPSRVSVT